VHVSDPAVGGASLMVGRGDWSTSQPIHIQVRHVIRYKIRYIYVPVAALQEGLQGPVPPQIFIYLFIMTSYSYMCTQE